MAFYSTYHARTQNTRTLNEYSKNIYISYIEEKVQNEEVEEEEEEALIHRNAHVKIMEKNILMNHRHNQYHHLTTIYLLLSLFLF